MQKGFVPIVVAIIVLILAVGSLLGGIYLLDKSNIGKTTAPKPSISTFPIKTASPSATLSPSPSASSGTKPTASPDETASWKSYEDVGLGFLLKYPPNNYTISKVEDRVFFQSGKSRSIWTVSFQSNTKKLELFDWLKNNYYGLGYLVLEDGAIQKPAQKDITVSPANVALQEAFEVRLADYNPLYNSSSSVYGYTFVFLTPDKSKIVTIASNIYDQELKKAVATFKFLSANPIEVSWSDAINILNSGKVVAILQSRNLDVKLTLDDRTAVVTKEYQIDDIFKELTNCQICKGKQINVATE